MTDLLVIIAAIVIPCLFILWGCCWPIKIKGIVDEIIAAQIEREKMSHKYLVDATKKSTCRYGSMKRGDDIKHGPIVATGTSHSGIPEQFDICDLHLEHYRRSGWDFKIRLNYGKADSSKDISSERAVASRSEQAIGVQSDLRSKFLDARKDLL
jgi:hypothetical protein